MLIKATTLKGYRLQARDGEIGRVKEFYFDDRHWTVRYLVVDTGNWLPARQVLISPHALGSVMSKEKSIAVDLTKKQIEDSPSLAHDKPVSRQFEEAYYGYYGHPLYWSGSYMWGASYSIVHAEEEAKKFAPVTEEKEWDANLRSTQEVNGYDIEAADGSIGHVEDFIIDDETWAIRYLVVDTVNWWPGKKVLVATRWIERVSWDASKVFINLPRESIKQTLEFKEELLLTRDDEIRLHERCKRQGYWVDESIGNAASTTKQIFKDSNG